MNFLLKSLIQNSCALLPARLGNNVYFSIQNLNGSFSNPSDKRLAASNKIVEVLFNHNSTPVSGRFLELGTGRAPTVPICLWLNGARSIHTIDLYRILNYKVINKFLNMFRSFEAYEILSSSPSFDEERYSHLIELPPFESSYLYMIFLNRSIYYMAPQDACDLPLPSDSFDFFISNTVLEHIPPAVISDIFAEASRVLCSDSLMIHHIDFSDHFSHSDSSISPINFLRYSPFVFNLLASNRFMYQNRLRVDDFDNLFNEMGFSILSRECMTNPLSFKEFPLNKLCIHADYSSKPESSLTCLSAWFTLRH